MERLNVILLLIIGIYLFYSYIKVRKKQEKKETSAGEMSMAKKEAAVVDDSKEKEYEKFVVAAAIAAVMGDTPYRIKRVFLTAKEDEKKSTWKIAGRQESMAKRVFFSKK